MSLELRSQPDSMVGTVLLGRYRIVRELAKGGMGVVYLARSEGAVGFVKPVVVKLVLPEHAADQRFRSMFVSEAQILSNLRHPSIVDVIELNEQDGAYVMVLEYVRGYHLGQWTKFLRLKNRPVPADVAIQIIVDVLDALEHAHGMAHPDGTSMHIVHRDVSPSNILLDEDGRARLLDFGVARMRGGNAEYHTQVKGFVGKLIYSAPEAFADGDATPQSDCYACAVVLHEMLFGGNTFRGDSQAKTLHRVLNHIAEPIEPLRSDAPPGLDAVLSRALSKAPNDRYDSARDFALALRSLRQEPESEIRGRLAAVLKGDFGREMSEVLGLESLADRDEAWRRLSHRPPEPDEESLGISDAVLSDFYPTNISSTGTPSFPAEAKRHTRSGPPTVTQGSVVTAAPRKSPSSRGFRSASIPAPPGPTPQAMPARQPSITIHFPATPFSQRTLWTSAAVLLAVASGSAYALLREPNPPEAPPKRIFVVSEAASPSERPNDEPTAVRPEPSAATAPDDLPDADARVPEPGRAEAPHPRRGAKPTSDARALSAALQAQQHNIESCFRQHTVSVQGLPKIAFAFAIDARGHVERATVSPPAVSTTDLGRCLTRVAERTQFPPQGQALSFSIPLSARMIRAPE